jgi:hypothetical protein
MVHCTENENGRWVIIATDGKATHYTLGWIDYKKWKEACKNCPTGPWGWGAAGCKSICKRGIVYIAEIPYCEPTKLYSAKIDDLGHAVPDKYIATGRKAWEFLAEQNIPSPIL